MDQSVTRVEHCKLEELRGHKVVPGLTNKFHLFILCSVSRFILPFPTRSLRFTPVTDQSSLRKSEKTYQKFKLFFVQDFNLCAIYFSLTWKRREPIWNRSETGIVRYKRFSQKNVLPLFNPWNLFRFYVAWFCSKSIKRELKKNILPQYGSITDYTDCLSPFTGRATFFR